MKRGPADPRASFFGTLGQEQQVVLRKQEPAEPGVSPQPGSAVTRAPVAGPGRRALRAGVAGQLREGAHRVRGGPRARGAAAATRRTPARALQLLALGRASSPGPAGLRAAHRVSLLAAEPAPRVGRAGGQG